MPKEYAVLVGLAHLAEPIEVELPDKGLDSLVPKELGENLFDESRLVFDLDIVHRPADNMVVVAFLDRFTST